MSQPLLLRILLTALLPALAYYIAGALGLLLAIPPGFASAIWPAAGVALAFVLLKPTTATVIGIGVGSFAANLGVISNLSQVTLASLITPALIASGASLQAAAGAWIYRRQLGQARIFDTPAAIARFMLVVAPVSCLIAASVGVGTLWGRGIITPDNVLFTWMTWWVGDTIGVLLVAPLALEIYAHRTSPFRSRRWQILIPSCVLLFCVTLLFVFSRQSRHQQIDADIDATSAKLIQALELVFSDATQNLAAHQALFTTQNHVSWLLFDQFSQSLSHQYKGLSAVGWSPLVKAEQRVQFEQETRNEGLEQFQLKQLGGEGKLVPAGTRDVYYPVQYIYPLASNIGALGFDLGSRPDRLAALMRASQTAKPAATEPLTLVQNDGQHLGLILYMPVYKNSELLGFVSGVFRATDLFNQVEQQASAQGFGIQLADITEPGKTTGLIASPKVALSGFDTRQFTLDFGGRQLRADIYADTTFRLTTKDWASWSILTFGFLITALFQALLLLLTSTNEQIGREVIRKTRKLKKAAKQAQAANQAKSDFLANMSHELRTPLNAITLLMNRCLKTGLDDTQANLINNARMAADTLMSLINHTLDFSKIGAGQLQLEQIEFSLHRILEKMNAIFSIQAEDKQVRFQLEITPTLPAILKGDPLRVEQILFNLCGNALKFTHQGSVTLAVDILPDPQPPLWVSITITDTGIGISPDNRRKLFSTFSQADSSTTRQYGGTGLGLAICKSLIDLMGGRIEVESEEGAGTRVNVRLPLETSTTQSIAPKDEKPALQALAGRHLLLVEDIAVNRELATYLLEDYGAQVTTAIHGRDALEQLVAHPDIDLILMDLQMPEMDGYQATAAIRQMPEFRDLPIIATTANAVSSDVDSCLAAGMNDHVGKPINEDELIHKICRQLNEPITDGQQF